MGGNREWGMEEWEIEFSSCFLLLCSLISCICFQAFRTPKSCKMQRPPLLIQSSQLLQFSAQFHQLVLGSLDLRNECFHSKLCQLGRKTDCCKSKCNHADSAKHIGFFFSLFKATSFYCKSFKSTFQRLSEGAVSFLGAKFWRNVVLRFPTWFWARNWKHPQELL